MITLLLVGIIAGIVGGMYGGGGFVIVPAMTLFAGMTQKSATGLSLGVQVFSFLGAVVYYKQGNLSIKYAVFVALGMILGNFLGATLANQSFVSDYMIKKSYAGFLLFAGVKYLFSK